MLAGSKQAVKKARAMVEAILLNNAFMLPPGQTTEVVSLPEFAVGFIIGKSGSAIKALRADTGARIRIDDRTILYKRNFIATVAGAEESVATAVAAIEATIASVTKKKEKKEARADKTRQILLKKAADEDENYYSCVEMEDAKLYGRSKHSSRKD